MSKPPKLTSPFFLRNHFVYFNLHKRCWSLRSLQSDASQADRKSPVTIRKGCVTGHADFVLAFGLTAKISETGRLRVIREKRKNVHAGLIAQTLRILTDGLVLTSHATPRCTYNPYHRHTFYDATTRDILHNLPIAYFDGCAKKVFYSDRIIRCGEAHFLDSTTCVAWIGRTGYTGPVTCTIYDGFLASHDCAARTGTFDCAAARDYNRSRDDAGSYDPITCVACAD